MSPFNPSDGRYRRPRSHFSDEKQPVPAVGVRALLTGGAMLMMLALLLTLALIPLRAGDPDATLTARDAAATLAAECTMTQQLTYAPCGHRVIRRQALPGELAGRTRADLEHAYDAWQVTGFSPEAVTMERTFALYCPQHIVLQPNESGLLCAWQNRYGDALSLVKELGVAVSELPDSAQAEVRQGKGFDSLEALEKWLESAES